MRPQTHLSFGQAFRAGERGIRRRDQAESARGKREENLLAFFLTRARITSRPFRTRITILL